MTECVLHTGALFTRTGYGKVSASRPSRLAHRALWIETYGPIADDLVVHHVCGIRACIELSHLALMDRAEHGRLHGRRPLKEKCRYGHLRTPENLTANRTCKECHNRHTRESKARHA